MLETERREAAALKSKWDRERAELQESIAKLQMASDTAERRAADLEEERDVLRKEVRSEARSEVPPSRATT